MDAGAAGEPHAACLLLCTFLPMPLVTMLLFSRQVGSTLCHLMDCSMPGFPVLHYLPKFVQTHVHRVGDAIQPSHALSPASPPALNLSQHQDLSNESAVSIWRPRD